MWDPPRPIGRGRVEILEGSIDRPFSFVKHRIYNDTSLNPVPNAQVCYFNNVWFMF
jgi:hypothetical protein